MFASVMNTDPHILDLSRWGPGSALPNGLPVRTLRFDPLDPELLNGTLKHARFVQKIVRQNAHFQAIFRRRSTLSEVFSPLGICDNLGTEVANVFGHWTQRFAADARFFQPLHDRTKP